MKELIKIEEELAQLKNSNTNNEECLVIDAANVCKIREIKKGKDKIRRKLEKFCF